MTACWLLAALLVLGAQFAEAAPRIGHVAPAPRIDAVAPAPRIGVMTMQPGEIFWERFGHDAIVVLDLATGRATSYNFGFFDPDAPGFISRFVRGTMDYRLQALPLQLDLRNYEYEGRGVSIQWLDLAPAQARTLQHALQVEAQPQNARYRYDYFTANCATRVRDAIDAATDGALRRALAKPSHGHTYRSESVRLASPAPWLWLGFDIGLSANADQPLSRWDDAFIPMRLAHDLATVRLADDRPLVAETQHLLPHRLAPEPAAAPRQWWPWALAGLMFAVVVLWLGARRQRLLAGIALPLWLLCAALGALMLFLWLGTEHHAAWANENLLLFSPLCLLALPGGWRMARGGDGGRWFRGVLALVAAGAVLALGLKWLLPLPQANQAWIALLLPTHLALWWALARARPH